MRYNILLTAARILYIKIKTSKNVEVIRHSRTIVLHKYLKGKNANIRIFNKIWSRLEKIDPSVPENPFKGL